MDLDSFRRGFKQVFGGRLVRTMNRTKSSLSPSSSGSDSPSKCVAQASEVTLRERSNSSRQVVSTETRPETSVFQVRGSSVILQERDECVDGADDGGGGVDL
eukprot:gnl/MRDRNA2_/MRDRNA2_499197_c0_seq1.p1 gnl/MRDRNA2_/MRDRNA2_499197_c0~~gnl/MRDRNA2_/MRDRNA2_499197_c0_seq1.p1  ORF type:complete len:114 (-),score=23.29 gnl/MRDRNA2_/MRDRNA2_499197_c0_seq1:30-335(-)